MRRLFGACSGSLVLLSLLVGCGGDTAEPEPAASAGSSDDTSPAEPSSTSSEAAPASPATPSEAALPDAAAAEAAIQAYFDAMRAGDTEAICALETESFKVLKYEDPALCFEDLANQQPQAAWAEEIGIVDFAADSSPAYFTITPNAGDDVTTAYITLVAEGGQWLVGGLT